VTIESQMAVFHRVDAATGNDRRPMDSSRYAGMSNWCDVDERRLRVRRPSRSATRTSWSRYGGARPRSTRNAMAAICSLTAVSIAMDRTLQLARWIGGGSGLCVVGSIIPTDKPTGWYLALTGEFVIVMATGPRQRLIYRNDDHATRHCVRSRESAPLLHCGVLELWRRPVAIWWHSK